MDKKNKQKRRLYELRNQDKLARNRKKRLGGCLPKAKSTNEVDHGIVPSYLKVIRHLDANGFALNDKSVILNGTAYIKVPEEFSISEKPNETIKFLRTLYAIGKNDTIRKIVFNNSDSLSTSRIGTPSLKYFLARLATIPISRI